MSRAELGDKAVEAGPNVVAGSVLVGGNGWGGGGFNGGGGVDELDAAIRVVEREWRRVDPLVDFEEERIEMMLGECPRCREKENEELRYAESVEDEFEVEWDGME